MKKGTDTRSLDTEDQLLLVTLDEALALFAQPKMRRGRGAAAAPLRELGEDPETAAPVVVRSGRFGPYVTDGTTNASLRKGDEPETITIERAAELLADRRAAGPPVKRAGRAAKASKSAKSAKKSAGQEGRHRQEGRPRAKKAGTRQEGGAPRRPAPPRRPARAKKASKGTPETA